jgi:superfamily I DNA/RNA helicase
VPISDERDTAPASLIRLDGSRFDDELATIGASLALLDNSARESFRDRNADDIARQAAARILIVAGPGSGKSTLFLARIKYWLPLDRNARIYVSSFVRKRVKNLG